ncbi:MAG: helix-turn-helix domain-containing protein [Clostridiales bacterium]|jgi:transcriptional regulator with XRE-family HTH domain|nr:helix-turn-helix domain-containing protein [Clostridiales bacterium]
MKIFGIRLKELRSDARLSQTQLARELNVSAPNICRWEQGGVEPTASNIKAVAEFFNATADYLLGLENDLGEKTSSPTRAPSFVSVTEQIIDEIHTLNEAEKQNILGYVRGLKRNGLV